MRWQKVGLDVSRIEKSVCSLVEGCEGTGLAGVASGRCEIHLGGPVGEREDLTRAQLSERLRAIAKTDTILF